MIFQAGIVIYCIIKIYCAQLIERKLVTSKESRILFFNQQEIIDVNKKLFSLLSSEHQKEIDKQKFAAVFIKFAPLLQEAYSPYCENLVKARHMKNKLIQQRTGFAEFLEEAQEDPHCNKQDLQSFLIKPLQRLCKYPLLLKELKKCALNASTVPQLDIAMSRMDDVLNQVNERMLLLEQQKPLLNIQDMFEDVSIIIMYFSQKSFELIFLLVAG